MKLTISFLGLLSSTFLMIFQFSDADNGNNIYNQLSNYLCVDFGLNKSAWIHWWSQVKDNFELLTKEDTP